MSCEEGCREVKMLQSELTDVWKEIDKTKSDILSLQTDSIRAEERLISLGRSFASIQGTMDRMSERIDKQLMSIVNELKEMSLEVQKNKTRQEFNITWKEITAAGIGLMALFNAIRPYIGG